MFNHTDTRVYGASYIANCSSVDAVAAFLDEPEETYHIEHLQGVSRFQETGLPCQLPAEREAAIAEDPHWLDLEREVQDMILSRADAVAISSAKRRIRLLRSQRQREALQKYQHEWVRARRDRKILSRGKDTTDVCAKTDVVRILSSIVPERGRLAKRMASDETLLPEEKLQALQDLVSLCTRDFEVFYRPEEEPIDGACPIAGCGLKMSK